MKLQAQSSKLQRSTKIQTPNTRETPNTKHQTPKKLQISSLKNPRGAGRVRPSRHGPLPFGGWILGFVWCLELGAWSFQSL